MYLNPLFWKLSYTCERNTSLLSSIAGDGEEENPCVGIPAGTTPQAPAKRLRLYRHGVSERVCFGEGLLFSFHSQLLSLGSRADAIRATLPASGLMAWHWQLERHSSRLGAKGCVTPPWGSVTQCGAPTPPFSHRGQEPVRSHCYGLGRQGKNVYYELEYGRK